MLRNYLSIAIRNIRQSQLYAFINIFSLAIGLAACMVIYLFIKDERSFDSFHHKKETLYRLDEIQNFTGTNLQKVALSMPGMGPSMVADYPEVLNFTRFWSHGKKLFKKDEKQILVEQVFAVDSTFLDLFDFPLLAGDPSTALDEPQSILLSEETALKFFPSVEKAIGNMITIVDEEFKISGIIKEVPENSHLQFDALISITTFTRRDPEFNARWGSNFLNTYLLLQPATDIKALEAKFPEFLLRHTTNKDINKYYTLFLQPLEEVHLASMDIEHDYNNYRKFNGKYLDVFFIIGMFILLIAGVNFMNLTTARASHRWKEIGVRKSIGAKKLQLFSQFIFESVLLAVIALAVAFLFDLVCIPLLNNLIGRQLALTTLFDHPAQPMLLLGITLGLGILTGIYPSLYMTSFTLARILKGGSKGEGKSIFRSSLVVVQFGLALAMIVSTFIVLQQLYFMKNKDIGFSTDQIMLVDMNKEVNDKFETLKNELLANSNIVGVTAAGQRLGNNFHQWGFKVKADTGIVEITPSNVNVDYDYLKVYGIKLKEGRGFSKEHASDNGKAFIINESFAKELALKETVGASAGHSWYHNDSLGTIIGVAEDFNFNSLHYKINTLSMVVHPEWGYDEMSIKVNGQNVEASIGVVKNIWDKNITSYPFTYTFLDSHFANLYRSDEQMSAVVSIMAGLAILISCMGLFGLAAITTEKKTKEIGIRKVLGATETQITVLLSRNFTWLIAISFIVVSPITYWLLHAWLENFAYRININPLTFLLGGVLALTIALLTISYHTLRSARANPVKALRYE
ncbi:ABC transporter permease [Ohtaekwangia koreensis]|uniref:Putative ABC transport system permease protein n=1 Tax=Ohtaekwangia koreensis TaxID=688867 RepID=A0A1T5MK17_9BACT|nr:ABC transporter permease [Ohtaekwangia koreensis]SKC88556.1 putative ABC transport system permease protein [Ohtaekwangia koreensis]